MRAFLTTMVLINSECKRAPEHHKPEQYHLIVSFCEILAGVVRVGPLQGYLQVALEEPLQLWHGRPFRNGLVESGRFPYRAEP